jgi:transposase-like protein
MNPEKTEERSLAIKLLEQGVPITEAARRAGISDMTVRRAIARLGRESTVDLKDSRYEESEVEAGWKVIHSKLAALMAERLEAEIATAALKDLRDGAVAYGILDDKLYGRGVSGSATVNNVNQVVVKTEWPEP